MQMLSHGLLHSLSPLKHSLLESTLDFPFPDRLCVGLRPQCSVNQLTVFGEADWASDNSNQRWQFSRIQDWTYMVMVVQRSSAKSLDYVEVAWKGQNEILKTLGSLVLLPPCDLANVWHIQWHWNQCVLRLPWHESLGNHHDPAHHLQPGLLHLRLHQDEEERRTAWTRSLLVLRGVCFALAYLASGKNSL